MTRGGLWLATALLLTAPLDARCDEANSESIVIQDASGRVVVVPAKSAASTPKRVVPVQRPAPTPTVARKPLPNYESSRPAAPAHDGAEACAEHDDLVERWLAARKRIAAARQELEVSESLPLSGMSGYRDSRIAAAEQQLERAEAQESEIDASARALGVPPGCFDDSGASASDE